MPTLRVLRLSSLDLSLVASGAEPHRTRPHLPTRLDGALHRNPVNPHVWMDLPVLGRWMYLRGDAPVPTSER
jgi:hypothetical protein